MKLLWVLFLMLLSASLSLAQDASANSAPPDLVILKLSWVMRPLLDPVHSPIRNVKDYDPKDLARLPDPRPPSPSSENASDLYAYSMKIKNTGAKTMTGVIWEYVFTDPKSNKELGRRRFYHPHADEPTLKIYKNQTTTLNAKSSLPPTNVVSAQEPGKDKPASYLERAEIKCVRYADGSLWKHAAAKESECDELEMNQNTKKGK